MTFSFAAWKHFPPAAVREVAPGRQAGTAEAVNREGDGPMGSFAFRNLRTRPARTALGLIGLATAILALLGLYSGSGNIHTLVTATLGQMPGFRDLPAGMVEWFQHVPGVRAVALNAWKSAPPIEGLRLIQNLSRNLGPKLRPMPDRHVRTRSRFAVLLLMSRSPRGRR